MGSPRLATVLGVVMTLAMIAALVLEAAGGFEGSAGEFVGTSWGRLTLLDLYLGLLALSAWMWRRESGLAHRLTWLTAFVFLGNLGVGLYLVRAGRSTSWHDFFYGSH